MARINTMDETKTDAGTDATDICVQHARDMLVSQLPLITQEKGYDFAPQFRQMTIQLYLLGACGAAARTWVCQPMPVIMLL